MTIDNETFRIQTNKIAASILASAIYKQGNDSSMDICYKSAYKILADNKKLSVNSEH